MGLTKTPVVLPTLLSPLGKACARMDLTAVHDILLKTGYKDEEGAENELSFQEWTQQVQDMLNTKKFGDIAFRDKDFKSAIDYYSKLVSMMSVPSSTVFVRRALSYLMIGQPELALRDAMQAQVCLPEWPTAFYMQALALSKLGMETDAQDMLNDGASFEAKRSKQLAQLSYTVEERLESGLSCRLSELDSSLRFGEARVTYAVILLSLL
ncbi:UNVERIFIED_CONTAM: Serine/threonine-protein kinase BSK2 [Sesamum angustifolium]|uniref:Serine/threonine-protein kinase BSK2 n=1 Tax=Sesamum angustifolium TaxID=2727405 RepID=A0AAW2IRC9_9LAMI